MPSPDACLIVLVSACAIAAYLAWVLERLPRGRKLLVVLAIAALVATVIVHDAEDASVFTHDTATFEAHRGDADPS